MAEDYGLVLSAGSSSLKRHGFHGLSYEYIATVLPKLAPEIADKRVILAHLGSGASLCPIKNRKRGEHTWFHGAGWTQHGNAPRLAGPGSRAIPVPKLGSFGERGRGHSV